MTTQSPDEELIEQIRDGSPDAFAQLVRLHQRAVRSFVVRHLGILEAADELSQDVFVAAYRSIDRYEGRGSVAAWLIGIARYRILTYLRNKQNAQPIPLEHAIDSVQLQILDEDVFASETEEERLDALRSCIESLSGPQRDAVKAFYFDGDSAEDMALKLNRPAGTVRMTLFRIRKLLRNCISKKLAAGDSFK